MKKTMRQLVTALASLALTLSVLTACGSNKPTSEDAENYVKAVLDLMCTGDYDHSVQIADIGEGQESAVRDAILTDAMDTLAKIDVSDETRDRFREVLITAFEKCRYNVTGSEEDDKGEFDVVVSIEPLKLFDGMKESLDSELSEVLADYGQVSSMSDREYNDTVYNTMIRLMQEKLESPAYADPETVTVHYGPVQSGDRNAYGISQEDARGLGSLLFSTEGL